VAVVRRWGVAADNREQEYKQVYDGFRIGDVKEKRNDEMREGEERDELNEEEKRKYTDLC
jgi:hypothetical protein